VEIDMTSLHYFAVSGSVRMKFGRKMLNHVDKQQILL